MPWTDANEMLLESGFRDEESLPKTFRLGFKSQAEWKSASVLRNSLHQGCAQKRQVCRCRCPGVTGGRGSRGGVLEGVEQCSGESGFMPQAVSGIFANTGMTSSAPCLGPERVAATCGVWGLGAAVR